MKNNKTYKVVKILSSQTVVINGGTKDGITPNSIFEIIGKGLEIKDPDTNESLGILDNVKETVSVVKLYENMCECSHISKNASLGEMVSQMADLYTSSTYKKVLNIDEKDLILPTDFDNRIKIGDVAKLKTKLPSPTNESTKN